MSGVKKGTIVKIFIGILFFLISILSTGVFFKSPQERTVGEKKVNKVEVVKLNVSVTQTDLINYYPFIDGSGEVKPKISLDYISDVSGGIIYVNEGFEKGSIVKKGDVLLKIESSKYEDIFYERKMALANAEITLLEEKRLVEQAKFEWKLSGSNESPNSDLVFRVPQLKSATFQYEQSKMALKVAENDLANTVIKSPFDAYISARNIEVGGYIQLGTVIAKLYGSESYEVEVALSQDDWSFLSEKIISENEVELKDVITGEKWDGKITKISKEFDSNTRQRSLFVEVLNPIEKGLYTGLYLGVTIKGDVIENVWKLPQTAIKSTNIDKTSNILIIAEDKLKTIKVINVYQDNDFVYIKPLEEELLKKKINVVNKPLITYKEGQLVNIVGEY